MSAGYPEPPPLPPEQSVQSPQGMTIGPILRLILYLGSLGIGYMVVGALFAPIITMGGISPEALTNIGKYLSLNTAFYVLATAMVLMVTVSFVYYIDKQPISALGFSGFPGWTREISLGILFGVIATFLMFLVSYAAGWSRITGSLFSRPTAQVLQTVALSTVLMVAIAVSEETIMRGYILRTLGLAYGATAGLVITSLIFGSLHFANPGASFAGFLGTAAAGLVLGYAYLVTGRLWMPVGFHFSWNFFLGPVFGFPVSGIRLDSWIRHSTSGPALWTGGRFGPEAGLMGTIMLVIVALVIRQFAVRRASRDAGTGENDTIG